MIRTTCLSALLAGCAIDAEADYLDARAEATCDQLQRCSLGFFDSEYSSEEDCASSVKKDLEDAADQLAELDCTYDGAEAGRCVRRIRKMDCESFAEGDPNRACDLVYDCPAAPTGTTYGSN